MSRSFGSRALVGLALVAVAGCGGGTGAGGATTTPGERAASPSWTSDHGDALSVRMRELATRLAGAGLTPGPLDGRGFLAGGGVDTVGLDVPAHSCLTIVALSSTGVRDLDATLFSPEGDTLAEDVEPDPHPTIQVCGGDAPRRVYYSLRAYEGAGAYLFASFAGPRAGFDAAAGVIGGRPGVAGVTQEEVEDDSRQREFANGVARRGFEPGRDATDVRLVSGQAVRVPLSVRGARCYTVAGFPAGGVANVDLRVLDDLGNEVARDVARTPDASVQFCVEQDADWSVEVRSVAGAGAARVAFYEAPVATVGGSSGLWLGERTSASRWSDPLARAVATALEQARATGWPAPREVTHGRLLQGEAVAHELTLASGRCSLVVVTGGRGLGQLAVRVVDPQGRTLARREESSQSVAARVCTASALRVRVEVVARRGAGDWALHTSTRSLPAAESGLDALSQGAVLDAEDDATRAGWSALAGSTRPVGERSQTIAPSADAGDVQIARGECLRVALVAGSVDASLELKLVGEGGRPIASAAGRVAEVQHCAPADRAARVHVEARTRSGDTPAAVRFWRRARAD